MRPSYSERTRQHVAASGDAQGSRELMRALLARYPDNTSAHLRYCLALLEFQEASAVTPAARRALSAAFQTNRHVPPFLLGKRALPETLPAAVGVGDVSEAVDYAAQAMRAWARTPGALDWLRTV